jgi:hypothetical protein
MSTFLATTTAGGVAIFAGAVFVVTAHLVLRPTPRAPAAGRCCGAATSTWSCRRCARRAPGLFRARPLSRPTLPPAGAAAAPEPGSGPHNQPHLAGMTAPAM